MAQQPLRPLPLSTSSESNGKPNSPLGGFAAASRLVAKPKDSIMMDHTLGEIHAMSLKHHRSKTPPPYPEYEDMTLRELIGFVPGKVAYPSLPGGQRHAGTVTGEPPIVHSHPPPVRHRPQTPHKSNTVDEFKTYEHTVNVVAETAFDRTVYTPSSQTPTATAGRGGGERAEGVLPSIHVTTAGYQPHEKPHGRPPMRRAHTPTPQRSGTYGFSHTEASQYMNKVKKRQHRTDKDRERHRQHASPTSPLASPVAYAAAQTVEKRHQRKQKKKKRLRRKDIPPPPKTIPQEYIDGYDSDESVYAPQFQFYEKAQHFASMDDSVVRISSRDMNSAFNSLKQEKGAAAGVERTRRRRGTRPKIGLDKEGELTEEEFYQKYWIEAGKLGEGSFARVRKITRKTDRTPFALKLIKKEGKSDEDLVALRKEIAILAKLEHPNVVKLTDWIETDKRIYMIVEFCQGGDVFERILKQKTFTEFQAAHVLRQALEGLAHIHERHVVHRDLKPDNLMYLTKDENSQVKIIDFGLAGDCTNAPLETPCGTAHYVAPEVLSSIPYGTSADMWSMGVIVYMLLCGFPPFFDATGNQRRLYKLIKNGRYRFPSPYWDRISDSAKDLIRKLLVKDHRFRFRAVDALKHKWVGGVSANKDSLDDIYMQQMKKFQSSKHFTDAKIGEEDDNEGSEQPIDMFADKPVDYD